MSSVTADQSAIFVSTGKSTANTTIRYEKEPGEELWEEHQVKGWRKVPNIGNKERGNFPIPDGGLTPGQVYRVCVYQEGHGRGSGNPVPLSCKSVLCLLQKPSQEGLILEDKHSFGGTWSRHEIPTKGATNIVLICASRFPIALDNNGFPIPRPEFLDGSPTEPLKGTSHHDIEINPLVPGNRYFFAVVVSDNSGSWEARLGTKPPYSFTTFRRQITVEFPIMHIYDDADTYTHGEAEFWFKVLYGPHDDRQIAYVLHLPLQDVDDWGGPLKAPSGRPYTVGLVHAGPLETVEPGRTQVSVYSRGREDDAFGSDRAESDEYILPLPIGRLKENVSNQIDSFDCIGRYDSLWYKVDVRWSVAYAP